jgi:hypothetical protein
MSPDVSLDAFLQFLADRSMHVVGYSGMSFFQNPLAQWLSQSCGCLVSVDTSSYSALSSCCSWPLPRWARCLSSWLETCTPMPLTGEMVFAFLAHIEVGVQLPRF